MIKYFLHIKLDTSDNTQSRPTQSNHFGRKCTRNSNSSGSNKVVELVKRYKLW